jgi:hypothetical protein
VVRLIKLSLESLDSTVENEQIHESRYAIFL